VDRQLERRHLHTLIHGGSQPHLDPLVVLVEAAHVAKGLGAESAAHPGMENSHHVPLNSAGQPRLSSYAASNRSMSLTRSVPSRNQSPGTRSSETARKNRDRSSGNRLPMVPPRKATTRRPPPGMRSRWCSKSPTMACTSRSSYSAATASE